VVLTVVTVEQHPPRPGRADEVIDLDVLFKSTFNAAALHADATTAFHTNCSTALGEGLLILIKILVSLCGRSQSEGFEAATIRLVIRASDY